MVVKRGEGGAEDSEGVGNAGVGEGPAMGEGFRTAVQSQSRCQAVICACLFFRVQLHSG